MVKKNKKIPSLKGGKSQPSAKAKAGTGERFKALSSKLDSKGVKNPKALAATIGRAKFGKKKMTKMATAGKKRNSKKK